LIERKAIYLDIVLFHWRRFNASWPGGHWIMVDLPDNAIGLIMFQ